MLNRTFPYAEDELVSLASCPNCHDGEIACEYSSCKVTIYVGEWTLEYPSLGEDRDTVAEDERTDLWHWNPKHESHADYFDQNDGCNRKYKCIGCGYELSEEHLDRLKERLGKFYRFMEESIARSDSKEKAPVFICRRVGINQMFFICPECGDTQIHSYGDGHRVSHCGCFSDTGYYLVHPIEVDKLKNEEGK